MQNHSSRARSFRPLMICGRAAAAGLLLAAVALWPANLDARVPFSMTGPAPEGLASFVCSIDEVAAFAVDPRFHVRCTTTNGGIDYYAFATEGPTAAHGDRLLTIANSAFALGVDATLIYEADSGENPTGCLPSNCRGLVGIVMGP